MFYEKILDLCHRFLESQALAFVYYPSKTQSSQYIIIIVNGETLFSRFILL